MNIGIIISTIFLPVCVALAFFALQKEKIKIGKRASSENFTVLIPNTVGAVCMMNMLLSIVLMILFTFFSAERPPLFFYLFFGAVIWVCTYYVVKTWIFRVVVKGEIITVYPVFRKPYTFSFDNIISAVRQVKKNKLKSERIVIKTACGRQLIVESAEISYQRFSKKVQEKVVLERLVGFEQ